jgi:hypothetical protein
MDFLVHIEYFLFLGTLYDVLIGSFEILAVLVLVAVILFLSKKKHNKA